MADIEDLKALVNKQIREGVEAQKRSDEADRRHEASQKTVDNLLAEIGRLRAAAVPAEGVVPAHAPLLDEATRASDGNTVKKKQ